MLKKCKGLVMEATFETLVVMTPSGKFVKVPWQKEGTPALGSEIEFNVSLARPSFFSSGKFSVLAASIVFFLLVIPLLSASLFFGEQQVVAYVSIDINPSLELGLDKEGKVKEARGLNKEGKELLASILFENLSVDQVVKLIAQEAIKQQYLTVDGENNIILTLSTREERRKKLRRGTAEDLGKKTEMFKKIQKELVPEIRKELSKQNIKVQAEILEISPQFYQNAKNAGVSPGKYAVILEAMKEGFEVSPEDVKFSNVVKVIKAAGGNPGAIISQTKKEEKLLLELEKEMRKEFKEREKKGEKKEERKEQIKDKKDLKKQIKDKKKDKEQGKKIKKKE